MGELGVSVGQLEKIEKKYEPLDSEIRQRGQEKEKEVDQKQSFIPKLFDDFSVEFFNDCELNSNVTFIPICLKYSIGISTSVLR